MKTRAFRKAISVICVLSMLLSLCVTSLVGTASAAEKEYTLNDKGVVTTDNAEPGSALPTVAASNFLGWYDKTLTTKYDVYPESVTELFAKYDGVTADIDSGIFTPNTASDCALSVVDDPDKAGNKVLRLSKSLGNLHFAPLGAPGAEEGLKLTIGKTYDLTFRYKIVDLTGTACFSVRGSAKGNIGTIGGKSGVFAQLNFTENTDGWQTASMTFTFNAPETSPYFTFYAQNEAGTATIYIDDVVIKPFSVQLVAEDYAMDFENDFEFSSGNDFTYNSGNKFVNRGEIVEIDGNKAFRLMHFQKKKGSFYFTVDDGEKLLKMCEGGIYTVSFDYFVEHSETETHVKLFAVNTTDGSSKVLQTIDQFTYRDDKVEDGWAHAEYIFIADATVSGKMNLGIGLYNATNCPEEYASSVLFDNIVVKTHSVSGEDALIVFDSMGGDECEAMTVEKNTAPATLPAPTRYGYDFIGWNYDVTTGEGDQAVTETYELTTSTVIAEGIVNAYATWKLKDGVVELGFRTNVEEYDANVGTVVAFPGQPVLGMPEDPEYDNQTFVGWYLDRNFKQKFDPEKAPSESVTLFAKWETEGTLISYEDYTITDTGRKSDRYKLITEDNGNKYISHSLEYGTNKSAGAIARAMFQTKGKTYRAYEGASYVVTFKYRISNFKTQGRIYVFLSSSSNTWGNYQQQSANVVYSDNTDGWVQGTIEFEAALAPEATAKDNYMSIACNGDATIDIDDVLISCPENDMNIYGSAIRFNVNGGKAEAAVCGEPGDAVKLPVPKRAGYKFIGWYTDNKFETEFTDKTFGDEAILLHAKWQLGKFEEGFEDYPASVQQLGFGGGYSFYTKTAAGFDSSNIRSGSFSIFRNGTTAGIKTFTLMRSSDFALTVGETYTLSLWVKPTAISVTTGAISLQNMNTFTAITAATPAGVIVNYSDLKEGEWQKVDYTFTAASPFVAIGTVAGCDMYIDDISITLKGYTGSAPTGDTSVNPMVILAVIILSAGALLVTGKKVFSK